MLSDYIIARFDRRGRTFVTRFNTIRAHTEFYCLSKARTLVPVVFSFGWLLTSIFSHTIASLSMTYCTRLFSARMEKKPKHYIFLFLARSLFLSLF